MFGGLDGYLNKYLIFVGVVLVIAYVIQFFVKNKRNKR